MTTKNSKGELIYSCPTSKAYKDGYKKIDWSKPIVKKKDEKK